jgi:hypothetical protein
MRTVAGSILFLAASICLAGGLVAEAIGKSNYGFGTIGVIAALMVGTLGLFTLFVGLFTDRRD